ncbi:Fc.00g100700.m01.CDS01 [Cosmosporella sp. VM-42]
MASASAAARLCILACRRAPRLNQIPRTQQITRQCAVAQRAFSTSTIRWARENDPKAEEEEEEEDLGPIELKKLDAAFQADITPEGLKQLDELAKENGYNTIDQYLEATLETTPGWASEDRSLADELMRDDKGARPNKQSFWFDDEDPDTNTEELEEFDEDDITSMAHGKLDEIREMRNYARLAVWEMPLLAKLAKPFKPPTDGEVLRWRYTSYMGEFHPAEKKVVVQFAPDDLKLTKVQTDKLKKLAGPRYNPETEIIKMSCESFEHQAQNKRYLSNLVDDMIASAKDPKDTFEDIPLDTRHHTFSNKPKFPKEWRLTDTRRKELAEIRQQAAIADVQKAEGGLLVDGTKAIEEFLMKRALEDQKREKVAELVAATPRAGAGGNRARR